MIWHYVCWKCINLAIEEHKDRHIGIAYVWQPMPLYHTIEDMGGDLAGVRFIPLWRRIRHDLAPRRLLNFIRRCDRCKKWRHRTFEFYNFGALTPGEKKAKEARIAKFKKRLGKTVPLE